jgi:hypothetical protein
MTYTPEKAQEIIERILELRNYWRREAEAKVAGKSPGDSDLEQSSSMDDRSA